MKNKIPPPAILLLSGMIMWFVAHSDLAYPIAIPFALSIGLLLAAAGILIAATAIRQFSRAETTVNPLDPAAASTLVDSGIFARTRNPMYLGLLLISSGWAVWLQGASNVLVLLAFVLFITEFQIKPEEQALKKIFDQRFVEYCNRVRRWI